MNRVLLASIVLPLCACPTPLPPPDASTPAGCVDDTGCGPEGLFFCDTTVSQCMPACRTALDCNTRPAEFALAACAGPLGCECDQGTCVTALCSRDADCGGQLACRNGTCVTPPAVAVVRRCSISPDVAVLRPGAEITFSVLAWDAAGAPVVVSVGATWRAVGTTLSGGGTGASQRFTASLVATTGLEPAVEASFGAVSCQARAVVVPGPAADEVALAVFDARSGRPIDGAQVLLTTPTGATIAQGTGETVVTDARGFAHPSFTADGGTFSVSVFHADYGFVTYANVSDAARSFSVPLERNPVDRFGGFAGTLADAPQTANLKLGRVGLSAFGELSSIDPLAPAARTTPTDITVGSAYQQLGAPVDSAEFLAFGDNAIKPHLSAIGQSGTCADEARVTAGACATRSAWSLAGDLPIYRYPFDLIVDWEPLDARPLFSERFEGFRAFSSSVVRDLEFPLEPTPRTDAGTPDLSGEAHLAPLSLPFAQLPLAFQFEAPLPWMDGARHAAGVGAVMVPGRGLVPLGLGVGLPSASNQPPRTVQFRMAPGHHGLEGLEYLLFVERVSHFNALDGRVGTALIGRQTGLTFDRLGERQVALPAQEFLALPTDVRVDFLARKVVVPTVPGATAVRVRVTDGLGARWDVTAAADGQLVTLPIPPGALRDRLFTRGDATQGVRAAISVEAQRTGTDDFTTFLQRDDVQADRAFDRLAAFSFFERPAPTLVFVAPTTIARGGTVRLAWGGFSPPRDGHARLSFTGGTGCAATVVDGTEVPLPTSCTGDAVTITAELVLPDGTTPLSPPVSTSVTVRLR